MRLLLALVVAGCAHPTAGKPLAEESSASTTARHPAPTALGRLLETNCAACHDEDRADRARLGETSSLSRTTAIKAAWLVSLGRMPPPAHPLTEAIRSQLIDELCRAAQVERRTCVALADTRLKTAYVRDPNELMRAIDRVAPATAPASIEKLFTGYIEPTAGILTEQLDTTFELFLTLVAAERCPAPKPGDAQSRLAFERCAGALLDQRFAAFPPPRGSP